MVLLGWAHTHPKFAPFLSATDLHFHHSLERTFGQPMWSVVLGYVSQWEQDALPRLAVPDIRTFQMTELGSKVCKECKQSSSQREHADEIVDYIGEDLRKTSNLFCEVTPKYVQRRQKSHAVFKRRPQIDCVLN